MVSGSEHCLQLQTFVRKRHAEMNTTVSESLCNLFLCGEKRSLTESFLKCSGNIAQMLSYLSIISLAVLPFIFLRPRPVIALVLDEKTSNAKTSFKTQYYFCG